MSMVNEWQHLEIPFDEIKVATRNFKTLIGQGGYGWVFKGKLLVSGKETMVAVKRLNEQSGQGLKEFLTEIQLLSGQQHPNLISLVGFCDEGREKSLVYEYAERGSLDKYIRRTRKNTSTTLTWLQRLKICTDAARGLDHLHRHVGGHRTIIHRDIKSSNILIDENWVGKISDLGLSKLSITGFGMSVIVSNGCGTQGYCEPEYYTTGFVSKKSDVYSFGVVLFEVLCGRLCLIDSDDGFSLSGISAKEYYKNNTLDKIIDQSLTENIGSYSMTKFAAIAYRCLHDDREQRPAMDVVVKELKKALKYQEEYEFENQKKSKSIVGVEDDTDEYWETKLPGDLNSLIKKFKIPHEVYTNKKELFSYLQKGIYFHGRSKFLWINTDGKKCLLISSVRFIEHKNDQYLTWNSRSDSRLKVVANYSQNFQNIKCRIKTSMLSLGTMYEASLVFKYQLTKSRLFTIKWKTDELNVHSTHVAEMRKNNWYTIKLWYFFNHVPNAEFDIVIDELAHGGNLVTSSILIQGIEFQPIKMCEGFICLLHDDHDDDGDNDDTDDDKYWEKKLPQNYQRYIETSDKPLDYDTKKELYHIFCHGFLAAEGQLWFSMCKLTHGICSLLSADKISSYDYRTTPISLSESRFSLVTILGDDKLFLFRTTLQSVMFSPQYTYACYLVFKFRDNPSVPDYTLLFRTECELDRICTGTMISYRSMYPMNIPTIKPKNDYGLHDSLNIVKAEGLAMKEDRTEHLGYTRIKERKDGWMEAMLFKLTNKLQDQKNGCHLQIWLKLIEISKENRMIIEGIEFRPYM